MTTPNLSTDPAVLPVAVVGLGLMGCSICTCLLLAGHPVTAIAPVSTDLAPALPRIRLHLENAWREKMMEKPPEFYLSRLTITEDYNELGTSVLVIECTLENLEIKKQVYARIESVIGPEALMVSNTSAIPITILQGRTSRPERFFGLHWAEPSHTTRFLEVICGDMSDQTRGEWLYALSHKWNKEPTLVRKDIRGFISNRIMYALYREACSLVEQGYASVEDVDRACRNNAGYWMTLVGCFRWMDLTGVAAYHTVMKAGGLGIKNGSGFYKYTEEEARLWEETFTEFSYEIRKLALKYPADVVERRLG